MSFQYVLFLQHNYVELWLAVYSIHANEEIYLQYGCAGKNVLAFTFWLNLSCFVNVRVANAYL